MNKSQGHEREKIQKWSSKRKTAEKERNKVFKRGTLFTFFKEDFIYLILEGGRERG